MTTPKFTRTHAFAAGLLAAGTILATTAGFAQGQMRGESSGLHGQMRQQGPMGPHGPMGQQETGERGAMGPGGMGMPMDMARHFIEEMIPHHDDAVVMAELALAQAEHPELRELAETIKRVQTNEINQMRQWYQEWYGTAVPASSMEGGMHAMPNPRSIDGARPFDRAFIDDMIPHHQMAVMMSTMAERGVSQPELRALLASIRTSQNEEIELMRTWYLDWYGTPAPRAGGMPNHGMDGAEQQGMRHGRGMGPRP